MFTAKVMGVLALAGGTTVFSLLLLKYWICNDYDRRYESDVKVQNWNWGWCAFIIAYAPLCQVQTYVSLVFACLLGSLYFAITYTDYRHKLIPDRFQILGLILGSVYVWQYQRTENILIAVLLTVFLSSLNVLYGKIRKRPGLGWGDVKMLAWISLIAGERILHVILLSCVVCGAHLLLSSDEKKGATFAFAPYLVAAAYIVYFIR